MWFGFDLLDRGWWCGFLVADGGDGGDVVWLLVEDGGVLW